MDNLRGPNPNTDYKRHFHRTKERFDQVTANQASRKKELERASLKQAKLHEELEYLLDAIGEEQDRAREAREPRDASIVRHGTRHRDGEGESQHALSKRQRPSPTDTEDELLEIAGEPVKRFREE